MKQKLQHTTAAKAGLKRKIELIESKPNKTQADIKSKPPLKSELIIQIKISTSANGGPRSRVCAHETLRSAPHRH
jgi:hypothetical protein